jgi:hypothetical protein
VVACHGPYVPVASEFDTSETCRSSQLWVQPRRPKWSRSSFSRERLPALYPVHASLTVLTPAEVLTVPWTLQYHKKIRANALPRKSALDTKFLAAHVNP